MPKGKIKAPSTTAWALAEKALTGHLLVKIAALSA